MVTIGLLAFEEMFEFVNYGSSWVKGQTMTLTFSPTNLHLLIKTTLFTIFIPKSSKLSMKSYVLVDLAVKTIKVNPRSSFEHS